MPPEAIQTLGSVKAAKAALRSRIRAERRDRGADEQDRLAEQLREVLLDLPVVGQARRICLYASLVGEPGTEPARRALRERGVSVLLPVVLPGNDLDWAEDDGRTVLALRGPAHEPAGPRLGRDAIASADAVLVPALAVDTLGCRLGQGGGSYDRALRRADPSVPILAVVHDSELLDAAVEPLPWEPHDQRVAAAVTPTRWLPLG